MAYTSPSDTFSWLENTRHSMRTPIQLSDKQMSRSRRPSTDIPVPHYSTAPFTPEVLSKMSHTPPNQLDEVPLDDYPSLPPSARVSVSQKFSTDNISGSTQYSYSDLSKRNSTCATNGSILSFEDDTSHNPRLWAPRKKFLIGVFVMLAAFTAYVAPFHSWMNQY